MSIILNNFLFLCLIYILQPKSINWYNNSQIINVRMRTVDIIVVAFVWGIIAFEAFSFLYLFASNLYAKNYFLFILEVPVFVLIVSILCASYYKSTVDPPGTPNYLTNINYGEEVEELKIFAKRESEEKKQRRKNKKKGVIDYDEIQSLNKTSYCFKCDVVKESRVHHCSICRKCIIRMDHHCPWIGNCVGKFNHKYFILFLFYATTGLLMVALTITVDYLSGSYYAGLLSENERNWLYIACITSYMLAMAIGFLFVTQMMTACSNITTLESFTEGIKDRNPWQTGSPLENLRDIFGYSNWLIPTNPFPDVPTNSAMSSMNVVAL